MAPRLKVRHGLARSRTTDTAARASF